MHKEEASQLFNVLGNVSRIKIVKVLYHNKEICACKFLDMISCKQSTLSHHLNVLLKNKLVFKRKEGTNVFYSCNKELVDQLMSFIASKCKCVQN